MAVRVQAGRAHETLIQLDTPGKLALYKNLKASPKMQVAEKAGSYGKDGDDILKLTLELDAASKAIVLTIGAVFKPVDRWLRRRFMMF